VLRELVEMLGHNDVVSYIQSGNVAFTAARPRAGNKSISDDLAAVIAEHTGVRPAVIVIQAAELASVVRDNPYPEISDHRQLHAVFLSDPPHMEGVASVAAAVERARARGSRDDARVVGRVLYLSTPDGFATSVLRRELDRGGANRTPMRDGSARNWATVTALTKLVGH